MRLVSLRENNNGDCWRCPPWHIASFRCAVEFCRYRGIAGIEQDAPQSRFVRTRVLRRRVASAVTATTDFLAPDILNKCGHAVLAFEVCPKGPVRSIAEGYRRSTVTAVRSLVAGFKRLRLV